MKPGLKMDAERCTSIHWYTVQYIYFHCRSLHYKGRVSYYFIKALVVLPHP
jgi:hypothetical protein